MQETDVKNTNKALGAAPPAGFLERRQRRGLDSGAQALRMLLGYPRSTKPREMCPSPGSLRGQWQERHWPGCSPVSRRGRFHAYGTVWWLRVP